MLYTDPRKLIDMEPDGNELRETIFLHKPVVFRFHVGPFQGVFGPTPILGG